MNADKNKEVEENAEKKALEHDIRSTLDGWGVNKSVELAEVLCDRFFMSDSRSWRIFISWWNEQPKHTTDTANYLSDKINAKIEEIERNEKKGGKMIPDYKIFWSVDDDAYIATTTEFPSFSGIDKNPIAALAILMDAVYAGREIVKEDHEIDNGEINDAVDGRR